jgi:hypothetical protein
MYWANFRLCIGRIFAYILGEFSPMYWANFRLYIGRIFAYVLGEFSPMYWANFRLYIGRIFAYVLGDRLLWTVLRNLQKQPKFLGYFFPRKKLLVNFDKNGLGHTLGDFSQTHPVTPNLR